MYCRTIDSFPLRHYLGGLGADLLQVERPSTEATAAHHTLCAHSVDSQTVRHSEFKTVRVSDSHTVRLAGNQISRLPDCKKDRQSDSEKVRLLHT